MGITVCPMDVVNAPVESVWELLSDPLLYGTWTDAQPVRIAPEGPATPGQMVYATTRGLGRTWNVTLKVEMVNAERHQITLFSQLLLGIANHATITCTALDATTCRVQFG